jgi:hypothetical protein
MALAAAHPTVGKPVRAALRTKHAAAVEPYGVG